MQRADASLKCLTDFFSRMYNCFERA